MRILMIAQRFAPDIGGLARSAKRSALALARLGARVDVVAWTRALQAGAVETTQLADAGVSGEGPLAAPMLQLGYRQSSLPEGWVIVEARFSTAPGDPAELEARMVDQIAKRDASQPTKERSAGSTFRNPVGHSSTGREDDTHELKAWRVIDDAGMRGATLGGAQMSTMHSNFLINAGGASAADLENLGEEVRKRVFQHSGITLEWEIMRVGEPAAK